MHFYLQIFFHYHQASGSTWDNHGTTGFPTCMFFSIIDLRLAYIFPLSPGFRLNMGRPWDHGLAETRQNLLQPHNWEAQKAMTLHLERKKSQVTRTCLQVQRWRLKAYLFTDSVGWGGHPDSCEAICFDLFHLVHHLLVVVALA